MVSRILEGIVGTLIVMLFLALWPNPSKTLIIVVIAVIVVALLWRWEALPDWVFRQQDKEKITTLDLKPPTEDQPLKPTVSGPASELLKAAETLQVRLESQTAEKRIKDLIDFATNTLLYADLGPNQTVWSRQSWKDRTELWKDHAVEALNELGASAEEKKHFQVLGDFAKRKFGGINEEHIKLRERLAERIKRLQDILYKRSKKDV